MEHSCKGANARDGTEDESVWKTQTSTTVSKMNSEELDYKYVEILGTL